MGQGQDEQGQRGDEEGNGDQDDSYFYGEDVFEDVVGEEEFAKFVWYGLKEMMDVQRRVTSFLGFGDFDGFSFWDLKGRQ